MSFTPPRPKSSSTSRSRPASPLSLADRFANVSLASTDVGESSGGGAGKLYSAVGGAGDTSNIFLARSTRVPLSPKKSGSLSKGAADSTLALSQVLSGMRVSDRDWVGQEASDGRKKSSGGQSSDRFIAHRSLNASSVPVAPALYPSSGVSSSSDASNGANESFHNTSSSTIASSLLASDSLSLTGDDPAPQTRILAFAQAPPAASTAHDLAHAQLRRYTKLATSSSTATGAGGPPGSKMAAEKRKRAIPTRPERVLDAPGMVDDYYLNLLAWSSDNAVAIGLGEGVYVWNAETGNVAGMGEPTEESPQVTSLTWAGDGAYLAVGNDHGQVEVWDVETNTKLRTMAGHASRVPVLSWHGHLLSSGCRDGSIHHHDVRVAQHKVGELLGHTAEVCGLTWRSDGQILASGGNDNVVNCWDARTTGAFISSDNSSAEPARGMARWTKRNHTAAVKALAWCPWQSSLLATGGGTGDQTIHFWSSTTGSRISSLPTPSQVTSLVFSPHAKELLSTHGFPDNNLCLWSYPSLQQIWEVPAHDTRVLASALSPDGSTVATAASDENLKFWKIWDARVAGKGRKGHADDEIELSGVGGGAGMRSKTGSTGGLKIR